MINRLGDFVTFQRKELGDIYRLLKYDLSEVDLRRIELP